MFRTLKLNLAPGIDSLLGGMAAALPGAPIKTETAKVVESSAPPVEVDVNHTPTSKPTATPTPEPKDEQEQEQPTEQTEVQDTEDDTHDDTQEETPVIKDKAKVKAKDEDRISDDDFGDRLKERGPKKADEVKPPVKPTKPAFVRDFTGFDENEVAALKGMSNESFAKFAPILKEYKALKPQVESLKQEVTAAKNSPPAKAYFDEHGFVNEPAYLEAREEENTMSAYYQHWQEQLAQIDIDDSFLDLQLAQDGKTVLTHKVVLANEVQKAKARAGIIGKINQVAQLHQGAANRAQTIRQEWGNKHVQTKQVIASYEQQMFKRFIGKEQDNEYIRTMRQTLGKIGQSNNPLAPLFSYMYAALGEEAAKVAELTEKLKALGAVKPKESATEDEPKPKAELIPSSAALATQGNGSVKRSSKTMIKESDMIPGRFGT